MSRSRQGGRSAVLPVTVKAKAADDLITSTLESWRSMLRSQPDYYEMQISVQYPSDEARTKKDKLLAEHEWLDVEVVPALGHIPNTECLHLSVRVASVGSSVERANY